jgi:hypothetical protein
MRVAGADAPVDGAYEKPESVMPGRGIRSAACMSALTDGAFESAVSFAALLESAESRAESDDSSLEESDASILARWTLFASALDPRSA